MTVEPTDKLLVNRDGSSFYINAENMAELRDTDLMLVCRDGYSYKATGKEIKDSTGGGNPVAPTIGDAVLTSPSSFAGGTFETTLTEYNSGNPAAQQSLKAKVVGPYAVVGETSPITDVGTDTINYSSTAVFYAQGTAWENPRNGNPADVIENMFNGSPTNGRWSAKYASSGDTVTFTLNKACTTIAFWCINSPNAFDVLIDGIQVYTAGSSSTDRWTSLNAPNGFVGEFTFRGSVEGGDYFSIGSLELDGSIPVQDGVDPVTVLNLTDDTNLHNGLFELDDTVDAGTLDTFV